MKKSDKKLDNQIIKALTHVCEAAKYELDGFHYVSHQVNFKELSRSLQVSYHFKDKQAIRYLGDEGKERCRLLAQVALKKEGILLNDPMRQIHFVV